MKTLPSGMQTDLDGGATTHCFCWKITRTDNTVMGFTDHDTDVVFDSVTFKASEGLSASVIKASMNMAVDDMETIGALSSNAITDADIANKLYDNAAVSVYRVDWTNVTKRIEIFTGFLGTVTRGKIHFKSEVRSLSQVLQQATGKVYQKTCNVDLGSTPCGVNLGSDPNFIKTGTVSRVLSRRLFATTTSGIISRPAQWFTAGKLTWTSGANNGAVIEIKSHVLQQSVEAWIDMWEAMNYDIQVGDGFTLQVGCDKTVETCKAKFNNVANFRGFPRMPGQDALLRFASQGDSANANDSNGGSWYK